MWFKTIFRPDRARAERKREPLRPRRGQAAERPLFDEAFLRRMERLSLQAQRTLRGNPYSGEHRSRHQMPATMFNDHRPYTPGDDLRYVDWNAYARQNHVLVKLGEAEQDVHVHLLLDASRSMALGDPPRLRLAQQLIGALGYLALAHSDRLHIAPFGAASLPDFGPAQGKARTPEMLRFVAQVTPQPTTSLTPVLQRHARRYPQGGILVLCSDLLAADDLGEALRAFALPRWQLLVLHMLDQRDLRPDLSGPLELEDSETGGRLQLTLDAETLDRYRAGVAAWRERLARACAERGATYAPIFAHWPLERQVVPYLRSRRLLT
jgi:uncharacterized protein (DUF58 family)